VAYLKILYQLSPRGAEKNNEKFNATVFSGSSHYPAD
jgi:hypothetical protein